MEWGMQVPQMGPVERDELLAFAARAEALGVDSLWVSDHIAWPDEITSRYPYRADGSFPAASNTPWLDVHSTLAFLAACTHRPRLGTSVQILGHRPPVLTAKAIATIDVLSAGRVVLGVGIGWMREEFEALAMPFDDRGERADEQIDLLRALWIEERPRFEGRFYSFPGMGFEPKPLQRRIPIWVGGKSEAALRRTVGRGDGFHAAFQPIEEVAAAWRRVGELCDAAGRDPAELVLSTRLFLDPHGVMPAATSIGGTTDQVQDAIGRWASIGVAHIVVDVVVPGWQAQLDAMEAFLPATRR